MKNISHNYNKSTMTSLAEIKKKYSKIDLTDEEIINNELERNNKLIYKLINGVEDLKRKISELKIANEIVKAFGLNYRCPMCETIYTKEDFDDWDMIECGCPNCGYPEDYNK
jgi:hypothetical protein